MKRSLSSPDLISSIEEVLKVHVGNLEVLEDVEVHCMLVPPQHSGGAKGFWPGPILRYHLPRGTLFGENLRSLW